MAKEMTPLMVLRDFFLKPGQTIKEFADELKELSQDEKDEMAQLAAVELGVGLKTERS